MYGGTSIREGTSNKEIMVIFLFDYHESYLNLQ